MTASDRPTAARVRPDLAPAEPALRPRRGGHRPPPPGRRPWGSIALAGLLAVAVLAAGAAATTAAFGAGGARDAGLVPATTAPPVEFENVSTTSQFAFVPGSISVTAGASVHLTVTQEATFPHTFVLSPVANYTIPTSTNSSDLYAFFAAHPPLVNLSVAGTPGVTNSTVFTAPPIGTYEFVCIIPGHFQAGMFGFLHATNGSAVATATSSPDYLLYGAIGVVVVVVIAAIVALYRRSAGPRSPPSPP